MFITGSGDRLQGYFDYRPKDTDEAVVAASSDDAGHTWKFEQEVLQLRTTCPNQPNEESDGETDSVSGNNDDNGDDDGQGYQFIMSLGGRRGDERSHPLPPAGGLSNFKDDPRQSTRLARPEQSD